MKISRLPNAHSGRIFVISELYGHFSALNSWLEQVNFLPSADIVILLGNFIGYSPSSKQAASYLAKPWVKAVIGKNEADLLARLQDPHTRNQTLVGQWLPMMSELARADLQRTIRQLPIAIEWDFEGSSIVFSQAPLPEGVHWGVLKQQLQQAECPLYATSLFMSRIDTLSCIGRIGKGPAGSALGVGRSISGHSVEVAEEHPFAYKNWVVVPSSARLAHNSCYDTSCILGSLDVTAYLSSTEVKPCHMDIQPALFHKKTSSMSLP